MLKRACVFLIILQLLSLPVYAGDYNALRKLSRGIVNTLLAGIELPRQMMKVNEAEGTVAGVFWGPLKGLFCALKRTAVGVYEIASFPLPRYTPLLEPEFIFEEEE